MPKKLIVFGEKTFKITLPEGSRITFGPFSPPTGDKYGRSDADRKGTLRIYDGPKSTANVIGVFSGVTAFRDVELGYEEQVIREEGAVIWKNDENEYKREVSHKRSSAWVNPEEPKKLAAHDDEIPF
jgi:hypothetical protein